MSGSSATPPAADSRLIDAPIDMIIVGDRLRRVLPDRVATLQESFRTHGQQTPIDLVEVLAEDGEPNMRLVFGAHRLKARLANGDSVVRAILHPYGTFGSLTELRLREVAENFDRFELTALEKAANVAALKEIHLLEHGPVKRGRKSKQDLEQALDENSAKLALIFPEVVQRTLGLSRREVFRHLKVASIAVELRDRLADRPIASNQSELLALADETPARQARIVELLLAETEPAASVAEAVARIDGTTPPAPLAAHERLSTNFTKLAPADQERFFDLHADDIDRWLAKRSK